MTTDRTTALLHGLAAVACAAVAMALIFTPAWPLATAGWFGMLCFAADVMDDLR